MGSRIGVDFFVVGFGIGSLLVIVGFVIRDLGPLLRRSKPDPDNCAAEAWRKRCDGMSAVVMWAGGGLIVLTAVVTAIGVSDSIATIVVVLSAIASLLVAAIGVVHHTRVTPSAAASAPGARSARQRGVIVEDSDEPTPAATPKKPTSSVIPPPPLARRESDPRLGAWQDRADNGGAARRQPAPPAAPKAESIIGELIDSLAKPDDDERVAFPTWGTPRPMNWPTTLPPEQNVPEPTPPTTTPRPRPELRPPTTVRPVADDEEREREFPEWTVRRPRADPRRQTELGGAFTSPIFSGIGEETSEPETDEDETPPTEQQPK